MTNIQSKKLIQPLSFKYPSWIENFPVKFIRKYLKKFYWKYGEILEF